MSDRLAAEGPAFWSPEARRGSAGGVGDGPGVEGSRAAVSGTQGPGAGGRLPPGLGAPRLGASLRALRPGSRGADPPRRPLARGTPLLWGATLSRRRRRHPGPGALELVFCSLPKCLGSCPASFLRSVQTVVTVALPSSGRVRAAPRLAGHTWAARPASLPCFWLPADPHFRLLPGLSTRAPGSGLAASPSSV